MKFIRKALSTLGGIFLVALLVAALAPKATHGLVAALVQIVPGTTTHVGQNESQLVSLSCEDNAHFCVSLDSKGDFTSSTPYVVPSGYTLIVTDYEWHSTCGTAGALSLDAIINANTSNFIGPVAASLADSAGDAYGHEHYSTGVRAGSGVYLADYQAGNNCGIGNIEGYLVPN